MDKYSYALFFLGMPAGLGLFSAVLAVLLLWSLVWKGLALWHSAKRGDGGWFVAILVINTAGVLEIIYLLFIAKIPLDKLFSRNA
jgi:methionyl-tRNA synthetase